MPASLAEGIAEPQAREGCYVKLGPTRSLVFGLPGILMVLGLLLTVPSGCTRRGSQTAKASKEEIIAVLNGREITRTEFNEHLEVRKAAEGDDDLIPLNVRFEEYVTELLLVEAAAREKTELNDDEFRQYQEDWHTAELPRELEPGLRSFFTAQKLVRKKIAEQIRVEKQEMDVYYKEHKADFLVDDQAHVLEILVPDEKQARELRARLRPRDFRLFRQIAREHSKGLTAGDGGDLGTFERGQLPEEFDRVVFALKPGGISQVFQSQSGFHIFMLEELIPRHEQSFHEVQKIIFESLLGDRERAATEKYLAQLKNQASVEIYDPALRFDWRESHDSGN